jgi:hypothetical protein
MLDALLKHFVVDPFFRKVEQRAFLLRHEMQGWVQETPGPTPDQLVDRGAAWLVRSYNLSVEDAVPIAKTAFIALASGHEAVRPQWQTMITERADLKRELVKRTGREPTAIELWLWEVDMFFLACRLLIAEWARKADRTP